MTVTSSATGRPAARRPGPQGGPPLLAPALAYGALMITGVILSARTPQPSAAATVVLAYERSHHTQLQVAPIAGPALTRALADLGFAAGSAGFVVPLGLLLAGVSVPAVIQRLTPRPWAWFGLAVAAVSVLATFVLLTGAMDPVLPIGRFGSLIWLIGASVLLPHHRQELRGGVAREIRPITS